MISFSATNTQIPSKCDFLIMLVNLVMVLMRFLPWIYCALSTCNSSLGLKVRIDDLRCAKTMQLVEKNKGTGGKNQGSLGSRV